MTLAQLAEEVRRIGLDEGLVAVGIAPARPFTTTRRELRRRRDAGLHGGMGFTYRRPEASTDPGRAVPGAAAIVVGARRYPPPAPERRPERPAGRAAAYTTEDHYRPLRLALRAVARRLKQEGYRCRVVVDDNALVDREAAVRAGLGWYGKSSNVLLPGVGSWVLLGGVITDAPLPANQDRTPDGCGSCQRCLDGCPTGAIVAPGVVDARRCLSWLLQMPGDLPRGYRVEVGDRLYGCDDCQEVCPPNHRAGGGPSPTPPTPGQGTWHEVIDLLGRTDAELLERFGRWYLPQRDPSYIRRNALVVLGNTADADDPAALQVLDRYLGHHDPLLRRHAAWAVRRLGRDDLLAPHAGDPAIQEETTSRPPPVRRSGTAGAGPG